MINFLKTNKKLLSIILLVTLIIPFAFASFNHIFPNNGDTIEFFYDTIFINKTIPFEYNVGRDMRFLPFQMLDYNLILLLPKSINKIPATYIYLFFKVLILLFTIYKFIKFICKHYNIKFDLFKFSLIIFTATNFKTIVGIAKEPVYSELLLSTLFLIFFYFYIMGQKTGKLKYYILSIILMFYMSYMKEVVFSLFWTLSLIQILFNRKNLTKFDKIFNIASLLNGIIFLLLYYFIVVKNYNNPVYIGTTTFKPIKDAIQIIIVTLQKSPFLLILIPIYFINLYKIIKNDKYFNIHLLSIIGGVYAFEFLIIFNFGTGLQWYYSFPLILAIPYIYTYINQQEYKEQNKILIILIIILAGFIIKYRRIRRTFIDKKDEIILKSEIKDLIPYIKKTTHVL